MSASIFSSTVSQQLAEFIFKTQDFNIPAQIRYKGIRHILDTIAAGIAGSAAPETALVLKTLREAGESEGISALWGKGSTISPLNAAFVNSVGANALELDDTGGCDHSGAVVLPAAIAAVELAHLQSKTVSGLEFITAVILSYELARRALDSLGGYAAHNKTGFHSTGTCGTFGAAACSAKILGLSIPKIKMALGIAGSFSAGLWAGRHDGAQSKRLHSGHASYGGLFATCLAQNGMTGPSQIFQPVWGSFNQAFGENSESESSQGWLSGLGRDWKIALCAIKPHASAPSTHSSIDAVDLLRKEHGFKGDDVERVEIQISPFLHEMCGAFAKHTAPAAQQSIPYCISAVLVHGDASLLSFEEEKRNAPEIAEMMYRINFNVDPGLADRENPTVTIHLKDGRKLSKKVELTRGHPENPLAEEKLLEKFLTLTNLILPEGTGKELAHILMDLESVPDVYAALEPLLRTAPKGEFLFHV